MKFYTIAASLFLAAQIHTERILRNQVFSTSSSTGSMGNVSGTQSSIQTPTVNNYLQGQWNYVAGDKNAVIGD